MIHYGFDWDSAKASANLKKHGISFDEAKSVFLDVYAEESFDVDHSAGEDRFMIIGMSERDRVLVVSFTLPDHKTIRIISARRANVRERHDYEKEIGNP